MKKKNLLMAAALMLSSAAAHADEGMWTLYNLPQAVYEQMKSYGFSPSYDQLYKSEDAIKNAVVLPNWRNVASTQWTARSARSFLTTWRTR